MKMKMKMKMKRAACVYTFCTAVLVEIIYHLSHNKQCVFFSYTTV